MGRRLSIKEMNMLRHEEEVYNSRVKRGLITEKKGGRHMIVVCGCGVEGCAFHSQSEHNPYPDSKYGYF